MVFGTYTLSKFFFSSILINFTKMFKTILLARGIRITSLSGTEQTKGRKRRKTQRERER